MKIELLKKRRKFHNMRKIRKKFYYFYGWFITFSPVVVWLIASHQRVSMLKRKTKNNYVEVPRKIMPHLWSPFYKKYLTPYEKKYFKFINLLSNRRIPYKTIVCILFFFIFLLF
jgi:hypothetical protein